MSALLSRLLARGASAASEALEPIGTVPGVTDYIFLDPHGAPVARTSNFGYDQQRLSQCTQALRRSSALVRAYLGAQLTEGEPLGFRFRNGWLLVWQLGGASLVVFGREGLELPTLRMRVDILRSQLADDKRLRRYLADEGGPGPNWLRETALSDEERCWIETICQPIREEAAR
jgi:hypothetical protein